MAARLHGPVDPEGQQWWHSDHPREGGFDWVLFRDFDRVYGCGEFTWAIRLVEAYPRQVDRPHGGWELPGPNQRQGDVAELLAVPDQHAVRDHVERHLVPDWGAVAADYDGCT
ncbi:hypothetical protein BH20ACT1_BH20ACT1_09070 [soil metagenome]